MHSKIDLRKFLYSVSLLSLGGVFVMISIQTQIRLHTAPRVNKVEQSQFSNAIINSRANNCHPFQNFGGERSAGLPTSKISNEARQFAADYHNRLYPAIVRWSKEHDGFLPYRLTQIANIEQVNRWSTNLCWFRLDGTMIGKCLSKSEKQAGLHDEWLSMNIYKPHTSELDYVVCGWDDGKVTFVPFGDFLERPSQTAVGKMILSDPPGSAGIPLNTPTISQVTPH